MALIGRALLILGLLVSVYGIGASLYGARSRASGMGRPPGAAPFTRWPA